MKDKAPLAWERYHRQIISDGWGKEGQDKLHRSKVLVVGAGGIGCPLLQYLVAAGVGEVRIVDGDTVQVANLHRQILFTEADIGQPKAEVAASRLRHMNSQVKVIAVNQFLDHNNARGLMQGCDLVMDGTDLFRSRYLVNDYCTQLNVPLLSGSVFESEGQIGLFSTPQIGPNYRSLFPEPPDAEEYPPCSISGINPTYPAMIGIRMAEVAISYLINFSKSTENWYEKLTFGTGRIQRLDIQGLGPVVPPEPVDLDERMKKGVEQITPQELKTWMDEGKKFLIVDVREAEELEICSLKGMHIPMNQIDSGAKELEKSNDLPKVVYCHHGIRSTMVIQILTERYGIKHLYNLTGGIDAWAQVVDPKMQRY